MVGVFKADYSQGQFHSTRFSVRQKLQDRTDGLRRLGVSEPKPVFYTSPAALNEEGEVDL